MEVGGQGLEGERHAKWYGDNAKTKIYVLYLITLRLFVPIYLS